MDRISLIAYGLYLLELERIIANLGKPITPQMAFDELDFTNKMS